MQFLHKSFDNFILKGPITKLGKGDLKIMKYQYLVLGVCFLFLLIGCSQFDNPNSNQQSSSDLQSLSLSEVAALIQTSTPNSSGPETKASFLGREWGYYTTAMKKAFSQNEFGYGGGSAFTQNRYIGSDCVSLDYDTVNEPTADTLKEIQFYRFSFLKFRVERIPSVNHYTVINERRLLDCTYGRGLYFYYYKAIDNENFTNNWVIGKASNGRYFIRKGTY